MSRQDRQRRARLMHRPALDEDDLSSREAFQAAKRGHVEESDDETGFSMLSTFDPDTPPRLET